MINSFELTFVRMSAT